MESSGRGEIFRRLLVGGCVVITVLLVWSAVTAAVAGSGIPKSSIKTPVWSPRRIPQGVADAIGIQQLQANLASAIPAGSSCVVADPGGGADVDIQGNKPFMPASTQKLLTSIAALKVLGPDFRFQTQLMAPKRVQNGSVDKVWLVGSGDPVLSSPNYVDYLSKQPMQSQDVTTHLVDLANAVVKAGIHKISGGVIGDESRYDKVRYLPSWPASYGSTGQIGPQSALEVNDGFTAYDPTKVPSTDPAKDAADTFSQLLAARGVDVGAPSTGTAPKDSVEVASVKSPRLENIIDSMVLSSDNLTAELLTKELGVRAKSDGTTAAGVKVIASSLKDLNMPINSLVLKDGSGLDRGNRSTCDLLLAAVEQYTSETTDLNQKQLPVAGESGTLVARFQQSTLKGKLHAKTGTLNGVTGMAGYVDDQPAVYFSFISNGSFSDATGMNYQSKVATAISSYQSNSKDAKLVPSPEK